MTDVQNPAPEAGDEVVADEAVTTPSEDEASEGTENTEGQDDNQPADPDGEQPEGEEKKSRSQERRERRKAEMERLRTEAAEFQEKMQRAQEQARRAQEAAAKLQPPKQEDFANYDEFQAAFAAYHSLKAIDGREVDRSKGELTELQQQRQAQEAARKQQLQEMTRDHIDEGRERYADFDTVALDAAVPVTDIGAEIIAYSDRGADLAYYLGQHRDEAAQIARLNPVEQARALGLIEGRLSLPKPNTVSKAPEPPTPVKGKGSGIKDPDKMSPAEYRQFRESGGSF